MDHEEIIAECAAMREAVRTVTLIGSSPTTPLLLTGETGTGKSMFAKLAHSLGARSAKPFVSVDCAAIPPALLGAELFGHAARSLRNPRAGRPGAFERAHHGTLFLDNVGTLPPEVQRHLNATLDERSVRRLGAGASRTIDVQVISAQADLESLVREGQFQADLFHRLSVVALWLPPLHERGEDVVLLARLFLRECARSVGMPEKVLSEAASQQLRGFRWSGNVRELRNQMQRSSMLVEEDTIEAEHLHVEPPSRTIGIEYAGQLVRVSLSPGVRAAAAEQEQRMDRRGIIGVPLDDDADTLLAAVASATPTLSRAAIAERALRIGLQILASDPTTIGTDDGCPTMPDTQAVRELLSRAVGRGHRVLDIGRATGIDATALRLFERHASGLGLERVRRLQAHLDVILLPEARRSQRPGER